MLYLTHEILTAYTASIASCPEILLFLIFVSSILDRLKFEDHVSCIDLHIVIFFWDLILKKNQLHFSALPCSHHWCFTQLRMHI